MADPWDQFAPISDEEAAQFGQFGAVNGTNQPLAVPDETASHALYRGVGDVAEGFGDVLGIVGNPLNAGINAVAGIDLSTDLGATLRSATGAPDPVGEQQQALSSLASAGAGGLAFAGLGAAAAGARGATGLVGRELAANPVRDVVASVTGASGADVGGDAGEAVAGVPGRVAGEIVGGLAGGGLGIAGARRIEQLADNMATRLPSSVALDDAGRLSEEGREQAIRFGVPEDEAVRAYARARQGRYSDRPPVAERQAAREAARPREAEVDVILNDGTTVSTPTAEAPQQFPNLSDRTAAVTRGIQDRVESGQTFDSPNAPPPPPRDVFTEAGEEGVQLTRGQAEQSFDVQNDENSLRVSTVREGEEARQFFQGQQRQIAGAIERLRSRFGADAGNAADRGQQVQDAVRELRDAGSAGVSRLYREAEALGGDGLTLRTDGIRDAATDVLIDELVPEGVKKAVTQELARYGIVGEAATMNEAGLTRVTLDDGSGVTFRGPVKKLTAANAEELRKAINRMYAADTSGASQTIKPAIDDALEEALTNPAASQEEGAIGAAYQRARGAHQQQRRTFGAKDIIDSLVANKKGTDTPVLLPERAIAQTIGSGADGVTNLRKVRALLLSSNTPSSRQAWGAIQHQALADIFDSAWSRNVNHGSGQIGDVISGAKLNSAIDTFGVDKLRLVLSPEDFNGLMKLRRIIGAATIPISGTTNPSGTFTKIANFMRGSALRVSAVVPGLSTIVDSGANLLGRARDKAVTQRTLTGITSYTGPDSGRRADQAARQFVADYVRSGKSGEHVPSSINLTAQGSGRGQE